MRVKDNERSDIMAQVNFRIDDETKRRAENLFESMGLTMSGAITIFIRQTLNRNEIPFPVQGPQTNREMILEGIRDWENGGTHFHEHTDEEVERLIAEAEKRQKVERRAKTKRHTSNRPSSRRRLSA